MANHKAAIKGHQKSLLNKARNASIMSKVKTFSKKVEAGVTSSLDQESLSKLYKEAETNIRRAVTKGVLKLNTASRKISKLHKKVKSLEAKA